MRHPLFRRIGHGLLWLGTRCRLPELSAVGLWFFVERLGKRKGPRYRILTLSRRILREDAAAIAVASKEMEFTILPNWALTPVARATLYSDPEFSRLTEQTYHHTTLCRRGKVAYRSALRRMFRVWRLFGFRVDAFLSSNFGYPKHQEIMNLGRELGFQVIVLYKEGLAIPGRLDELALVNRGKKFRDFALFYNETIREAVMRLAFSEVDSSASCAAGIPRLDRYAVMKPPAECRQVTFFSFSPSDKFGYLDEPQERKDEAIARGDKFHRAVIEAAARCPEVRFVIKTKNPPHYLDYVNEIVASMVRDSGCSLSNVEVTNLGDAGDFIAQSFLVIGFASTTLIEALLARREVACPDYRNFFGAPSDYFEDFPELVTFAESAEDIVTAIRTPDCHGARGEHFESRRREFLEMMVHTADGDASLRAAREIEGFLAEKRDQALVH